MMVAQTCSIDQSFLGGDTRPSTIGSNTALPDGQSFKAGMSGALYSVSLDLSANNPGCLLSNMDVKMDILNGSGIGGTVLASQTFSLPTNFSRSLQTFNFSSPAIITATQMYTIIFTLLPSQDCGSGEPNLIWYFQFPTGYWSATGGTQFENGVITSLGNTQYFRTCVGPACFINDQTVNTPSPATICGSGSSTISLAGSDNGVFYYLRNDANNAIVDGPVSGNGSGISFNTGTINSTTTYNVHAVKDYAVNLPAANDHVRFSSPFTSYTNAITIESSVYSATGDQPWAGQSVAGVDNMSTNVWLWHAGSFLVNDGGNWIGGLNFPPLPLGWTHIATVADATGMYIYYDGVLVASNTTGLTGNIQFSASSIVDLGHDPRFAAGTPGRNTNVAFDDFRIWKTARTASEIAANMSNCIASDPNLVLNTHFKEGAGVNILSESGSNGQIINPSSNNWIAGAMTCPNCQMQLSQTATVTVNDLPEIVYESGDVTVCGNATGTFSVIANNTDTYAWEYSSGGSPNVINGTYGETGYDTDVMQIPDLESEGWDGYYISCVLTSADGCSINTSLVLITVNAVPDAGVTDNSPTLTADQAGATYQWIDCDNGNDPIAGETNQSFTATASGNYAVIVTLNGCSETSTCFPVTVTGIATSQNNSAVLTIYPNPATENLNIAINKKGVLAVYSLEGKLIETLSVTSANAVLNVKDYANGMYMIKFTDENGNLTHSKFVKK